MDITKIVESNNDFVRRFNINYRQEEPVYSLKVENNWIDFTCSLDNFQTILEQQLKRFEGKPFHLYRATGTFKKGSIRLVDGKTIGRLQKNLERVLEIPLDADYLKFVIHEKGADREQIEELEKLLHGQPDDKLSHALEIYLRFIKHILEKAKVPYSEIIRSGYGYNVKVFIEDGDQSRIKEIRQFHKELVSYLNDLAGFELFDKNCTDAGTRVTRIEGSYNLKNPDIPRLVYRVEGNNEFYKLDDLIRLIPKREKVLPPIPTPHGI